MNNKGKLWEIEAANYLRKHKYKLVDVNYTTRFGEIDLIAKMYLMQNKTDLQPRFDVIEIYTDNNKIKSIKHLENAFQLV